MLTKDKGSKKKKTLALVSTSEENISNMIEQMDLLLNKNKKYYRKFKRGGKPKADGKTKMMTKRKKETLILFVMSVIVRHIRTKCP